MAVFDIQSDSPLPALPAKRIPTLDEVEVEIAAEAARRKGKASLWLTGDALMCACPDCRAPLTVRTWLMVADCWNCGTSIELSEEQEREARRLLDERKSAEAQRESNAASDSPIAKPVAAAAAASASVNGDARKLPDGEKSDVADGPPSTNGAKRSDANWDTAATRELPRPPQRESQRRPGTPPVPTHAATGSRWSGESRLPSPPPPASRPAAPTADRRRTPAAVADTRRRIRRISTVTHVNAWLSNLLRDTPAWLISAVIHFIFLTLLALITVPEDADERFIVLSTQLNPVRDGRQPGKLEPENEVKFDLPVPENFDQSDEATRQALIRANQDARELRVEPDAFQPRRPDLENVKDQIGRPGASRTLAARDPRVRVEMVEKEGGTTQTEAAVARALRFLAAQQNDDGGWSLSLRGSQSDEAATSLALLPFLGAGQSHLNGIYTDKVAGGLRWLVDHQREDGDLRHRYRSSNHGMYAQGQGAIVLCEAFALEGDERLRAPAQKAIDFIVAAQHQDGGWRYQPGQAGDTSVVGWQLMALQSARVAGLSVPDSAFSLSQQYLDGFGNSGRGGQRDRLRTLYKDGALYGYQPGREPTPAMTAEALLCRMYNGWTQDQPQLGDGVAWLADNHMPNIKSPNLYYWYYGTQVFHHVGGIEWDRWNFQMRDILIRTQQTEGRNAGSWPPRGPHDSTGGLIYTTSLSACTLEVYYRHLPIFRQIDLE
jgi:hypothetical protein